jgi:hypothetical protein
MRLVAKALAKYPTPARREQSRRGKGISAVRAALIAHAAVRPGPRDSDSLLAGPTVDTVVGGLPIRRRIWQARAVALAVLIVPSGAMAYRGRRASRSEVSAIVKDAKRTQPCGYNGKGHLSAFRVVQYTAKGVSFKWAEADWTTPGANGCDLVFLHAGGYAFSSNQTPRRAQVDWLPFTWGSSPFDDSTYLNQQWRELGFKAGPPRWIPLARAL